MAVNLEVVGKKADPVIFTYDEDDVILYALSIGAGVDELDFIYEKNLKVFPTFSVVPLTPIVLYYLEHLNLNLAAILHTEQKISLHKPILPKDTIIFQGSVASIYDMGDKGAIANIMCEGRSEEGELIFEVGLALMDRSSGNFGGERGPKVEKIMPPEGQHPDFTVDYHIPLNQAVLYRLNGDKNPLHIDPEFAALGGFEKPVLHGLCTYGYTGRAILHSICGSDPSRFKAFFARFMGVVFPGDTLTIQGWKAESKKYIIQTKNQKNMVVLGNAWVEVA
jgi:acyl dehydratase